MRAVRRPAGRRGLTVQAPVGRKLEPLHPPTVPLQLSQPANDSKRRPVIRADVHDRFLGIVARVPTPKFKKRPWYEP
jgi:hypothetical protein